MDALIKQVKHEANSLDEVGRKKILDDLRDLALSIETPEDSVQRIYFLVRLLLTIRSHCALNTSEFLTFESLSVATPDCRHPCGG